MKDKKGIKRAESPATQKWAKELRSPVKTRITGSVSPMRVDFTAKVTPRKKSIEPAKKSQVTKRAASNESMKSEQASQGKVSARKRTMSQESEKK
jgi:hypothetical protein